MCVDSRPSPDEAALPLVVVPRTLAQECPGATVADCDGGLESLLAWVRDERVRLDELLHRHGALLLSGFALQDVAGFERVCRGFHPQLAPYVGGDSPRRPVGDSGRVYTSTEYPAHLEVGLHNEMSYAPWSPSRVFFWCRVAAVSGGATHLADGRRVLAALPPDMVEQFARRGVAYLQHLPERSTVHKTWRQTFETDDRATVERWCEENGVDYRWTARGLSTRAVRPAVVEHPVSGESAWFNQVDQWRAAGAGVKQQLPADDEPVCDATYGDGATLRDEDMAVVAAALHRCEVVKGWRRGELLVLDNLLTMHGRKPFAGERRVLVALA
jgi:alpha-ketoglutarate-dependent taurine dioxygenase